MRVRVHVRCARVTGCQVTWALEWNVARVPPLLFPVLSSSCRFFFISLPHFYPSWFSPLTPSFRPRYSLPIISLQLFHSLQISITGNQLHFDFTLKVRISRSKMDRCRSYVQRHPTLTNAAASGFISGTLTYFSCYIDAIVSQFYSGIQMHFFCEPAVLFKLSPFVHSFGSIVTYEARFNKNKFKISTADVGNMYRSKCKFILLQKNTFWSNRFSVNSIERLFMQ